MMLFHRDARSCGSIVVWFVAVGLFTWAMGLSPAAAQPVTLPIYEVPYQHEAALGYNPDYIPNTVTFDSFNRPYMRSRAEDPHTTGYIQTLRNGQWVNLVFTSAIQQVYPNFTYNYGGGTFGAEVVFDADDDMYTLVRINLSGGGHKELLLYSTDYGDHFQVYTLPKGDPAGATQVGFYNIEQQTGHNTLTRPPLLFSLTWKDAGPAGAAFTSEFYLDVLQPTKVNGQLVLPNQGVRVTDNAMYMNRQSGNASVAVSGPDKTYITWAETTDNLALPGSPTYIATFDPTTGMITDKTLVGYADPINDGHDVPGIVIDSQGYLHIIIGAHGENFLYSKSVNPYSTASMTAATAFMDKGWVENSTERGRQTYLSFVCGDDDALHTVYRKWITYPNPFGYYGALVYQGKDPGQDWDAAAMRLIVPPIGGYSIYYQNLTTDQLGNLFLSYGYRSDQEYYGTDEAENHYLALLMSEDGGTTWRLVTKEDFLSNVLTHLPPQIVPGSLAATPGGATVSVTWDSDEKTRGLLLYGSTTALGQVTPLEAGFATNHSITVSDWPHSTPLYFRIVDTDPLNQVTTNGLARSFSIPRLTANAAAGNSFRSRWISDSGQWRLLESAEIAGSYTQMTNLPVNTGISNSLTLPAIGPQHYFKLERTAVPGHVIVGP